MLHVESRRAPDGYRLAVLLDRTACHPVDAALAGSAVRIARCSTPETWRSRCSTAWSARPTASTLFLGADIPVRKGTEGWAFVVAHLVDGDASLTEGDTVTVEVDAEYRAALSAGHSACHLASLALNAALAGAWTKEPRLDSLGSPDFDGAANETSTILERGARDTYRIGKSLRKAGFDPAALDDPDALAASVERDPRILDRDRRRDPHRARRRRC